MCLCLCFIHVVSWLLTWASAGCQRSTVSAAGGNSDSQSEPLNVQTVGSCLFVGSFLFCFTHSDTERRVSAEIMIENIKQFKSSYQIFFFFFHFPGKFKLSPGSHSRVHQSVCGFQTSNHEYRSRTWDFPVVQHLHTALTHCLSFTGALKAH